MLTVTKEITFAAAHSLPFYDGPCFNLHGHEWKVQVTISGHIDPHTGMILDFVDLKKWMRELIHDKYDHAHINDMFENPTAENMVMQMVLDMQTVFGVAVQRLRLYETPTSYAEWTRS